MVNVDNGNCNVTSVTTIATVDNSIDEDYSTSIVMSMTTSRVGTVNESDGGGHKASIIIISMATSRVAAVNKSGCESHDASIIINMATMINGHGH